MAALLAAGMEQHPSSAREVSAFKHALQTLDRENWDDSILAMEEFVRHSGDSDLADNALYWIATLYLQKGETRLAQAELERLVITYPNSDRTKRAVRLLKDLNSKDLQQELLSSSASAALLNTNAMAKGNLP